MAISSVLRVLRRVVLALYVLALILPNAVSAGVQLSPTLEFSLVQDLANDRCIDGKGRPALHHGAADCCILCDAGFDPRSAAPGLAIEISFPQPVQHRVVAEQTGGMRLGISLRPPNPRGPPALL